MNFDPLSFVIGKHGDYGPVRDVVSYLIGRVAGTAGEIWQTLTNVAVASFTAVSTVLRSLVIDIMPVQATGTPTPETPLPISGWTGANIDNYGPPVSFTAQAKSFNYNTGEDNDSTQRISSGYFPCDGRDFIVASSTSDVGEVAWCFLDSNGVVIPGNTHSMATRYIISIPTNAVQAKVRVGNQYHITTPASDRGFTLNLGINYPVSWQSEAGKVYGGTLRDNGDGTWTLTATHNYQTYDGTETWTELPSGPFSASIKVAADYAYGNQYNLLSNVVEGVSPRSSSALVVGQAALNVNRTTVNVRVNMTLAEWTTFLGTTPMQIVAPLATPQTYTLTADSVQALIGQNNIFADTGNINTITFRTH